MVKQGKNLTTEIKQLIVNLREEGYRWIKIAEVVGRPESTIRAVYRRFQATGSVETCHRGGAVRKLSARGEADLLRFVRKNRGRTLNDLVALFNIGRDSTISLSTLRRVLSKHKIGWRVQKKSVRITEVNRKKRLLWCRQHRWWTVAQQWSKVIFSDESQVVIGGNNKVYVWRSPGEGYYPDCLDVPRQPKVSCMIWGCITWNGIGTLCKVDGNINALKYREVLEDQLWPVIARHFPNGDYRFQDDNAPVHRARLITDYKRDNSVNGMTWPAQSPDLNIIENIWWRIKRTLRKQAQRINTRDELFAAIHRVWDNITLAHVQNLYNSLPRRMQACLRNKGYMTKY